MPIDRNSRNKLFSKGKNVDNVPSSETLKEIKKVESPKPDISYPILDGIYLLDRSPRLSGFVGDLIELAEMGVPVVPITNEFSRGTVSKYLDTLVERAPRIYQSLIASPELVGPEPNERSFKVVRL